jgi:hypothetical protein
MIFTDIFLGLSVEGGSIVYFYSAICPTNANYLIAYEPDMGHVLSNR